MDNEKFVFTATPFLITIDGPDGVGKSTFSEILTREIQKKIRQVKLIKPTRFDSSVETQQIEIDLRKASRRIKIHSKTHNRFFLKTTEINYRNLIITPVQNKQLVIVDSSEIRALAFILEKGTTAAIKDTVDQISRGILTCGIKPERRIILFADPQDLYKNLRTKKGLDIGDPRNIDEIRKRIETYKKAIQIIQNIEGIGTKWIYIKIQHSKEPMLNYFLKFIPKYCLIPTLTQGERR